MMPSLTILFMEVALWQAAVTMAPTIPISQYSCPYLNPSLGVWTTQSDSLVIRRIWPNWGNVTCKIMQRKELWLLSCLLICLLQWEWAAMLWAVLPSTRVARNWREGSSQHGWRTGAALKLPMSWTELWTLFFFKLLFGWISDIS